MFALVFAFSARADLVSNAACTLETSRNPILPRKRCTVRSGACACAGSRRTDGAERGSESAWSVRGRLQATEGGRRRVWLYARRTRLS